MSPGSEPRFLLNPRAEGILKSLLKPAAEACARILVNTIKDTLEDAPARTGREYYVPGTHTKYTASAPGEIPAVREGKYRDSWKPTKAFETDHGIAAAAFTDLTTKEGVPIALILEDGTSDIVNYKARMQPRPHLREALIAAEPLVQAKVDELVRKSS